MESAVTPFTEGLFPLFLRSLADPESEVQSNGAFAMGSLILHSETDLSSQYLNILGVLHPLFGPSDDRKKENARDNACGCVSRMIIKSVAAVPLDQVLPVLLQALPLKRDFAESEKTVSLCLHLTWNGPLTLRSRLQFAALFALFRAQNPIILANLDHLLNVFAHALASLSGGFYPAADGAQLTEETRDELVQLIKAIAVSQPEKIQAAGLTPFLA